MRRKAVVVLESNLESLIRSLDDNSFTEIQNDLKETLLPQLITLAASKNGNLRQI